MALLNCEECGNVVSTKAKVCQKCGAEAPKEPVPVLEEKSPPGNIMSTFLVILTIGGIILWECSNTDTPTQAPSTHEQSAEEKIASNAIASLEMKSNWEKIDTNITKNDTGNIYSLNIIYNEMPSGCAEVENDTKEVAQSLLKMLIASGADLSENHTDISVNSHLSEKAPTAYWFGSADYNYLLNEFVFHPLVTPGSEEQISNKLLAPCQNHSEKYTQKEVQQAEDKIGEEEQKMLYKKNPELKALADRTQAIKEGRAVPEMKLGDTTLPPMSESDIANFHQRYATQ